MKAAPRAKVRRSGFTLIELLVVIAIIAIIASLLLAAVVRLLAAPDTMQNRKDIDDLHRAAVQFAKDHNGNFPPPRIMLSNDPKQYTTHPLGPESKKMLLAIWPKLPIDTTSIDWSGGTMQTIVGNGAWTVVLEGDQCLVYFLGGLPSISPYGCQGFANSSTNPTNLTAQNKVAPLYPFLSDRLYQRDPKHTFLSYKDVYGQQPFAYFAVHSKTVKNSYNDQDCASLGVAPYFTSVSPFRQYVNPDSFQIISAGPDMTFGAPQSGNGVWDPQTPNMNPAGLDDISNFSGAPLGQAQK